MSKTIKRPSIKSPCVADRYAMPGERIAEVSFPDGSACLISLRVHQTTGGNILEIYRKDDSVTVWSQEKSRRK